MDFIFISMPYTRFISKWFSNVPNINLGIMQALLTEKKKSVQTFHFHLEFLPYLMRFNRQIWEKFINQTEQSGIEYLGLDYVFASLLFEKQFIHSRERFRDRLNSIGLSMYEFEKLQEIARSFISYVYSKLSPCLKDTKTIGFSCSHYQLSSSLLLCSQIKKEYPDIQIILGGKDCSGAFAYELLKNIPYIDFVGTGECEVTLLSFLEHIRDSGKDFYNLVFRDKDGNIVRSKSKPNFSINSIPFPQYDFKDFPIETHEIILPVEFGRGCPWKRCSFCPDESYNILCQTKTADRVKAEIDYYQGISKDLRNFFILDSDALKDPETITGISQFLEGKDFNFIYAEFRAERMDREVLDSILRFGNWVSNFQIGIETFSDRVLQLMNKGVTVLKNVEVLKAAAESNAPIQFNLFTCFPRMTFDDLNENLRVMDFIKHFLVHKNILIYPGAFYLPTDCPVFLHVDRYKLTKNVESIFSCIFENFPMPSYSNYPYPYQFENKDEQFRISKILGDKVSEIKSKSPLDTFIIYKNSQDNLQIFLGQDEKRSTYTLSSPEKEIYLSAIERSQRVEEVSEMLGIPLEDVSLILDDFEQKRIILFSSDRKSFLSLAMKETGR